MAFFNEETDSLVSVIDTVKKVSGISQIVCVDDGSTNNTFGVVKNKYPDITLIKLQNNAGKAKAVLEGFEFVTNNNLLLMDADLKNLKVEKIQNALEKFEHKQPIDMIILENKGGNKWIDPLVNKNIFLSGQRVLRKSDLENIFNKKKPKGYQLEVAINAYMIENNKKVYYVKTSSFNPHKIQKLGIIKGILKDLKMDMQIILYESGTKLISP